MRRTLRPRWRLLFAALSLLALSQAAAAQNLLYHIRGNVGGNNNIWVVNSATGVETLVYANYTGGNAATIAQRPSDGMLFFAINPASGINGEVFRFNPATPNVAPVSLGNLGPIGGAIPNVSSGFRMAFNGNTLYYMVGNAGTDANSVYTVNQTTGLATRVSTLNNTNNGGDMAFNGSTLYIVDQNRNLFTSTTLTGNATAAGTIAFPTTGTAPNTIGISFIGTQMYVQTVGDTAAKTGMWTVTGTTAALVTQIGGGTAATGDLASAAVPAPNLSITKTVSAPIVYRGGPVSYTITVTNSSAYAVTGTVVDNVPASVTGVTWTCAATLPSFCENTNGSGNAINTDVTLASGASATFDVDGTISATAPTGVLTNQATVSTPAWLIDSNLANNTSSVNTTVTLNANLGITKTDGLANVNPGATVTYTVVVSNAGPDTSNGSVVTDTVPAALTGVTWTCGSLVGGATCGAANGSGNAINTTANLPSGGSVTYTITGTVAAGSTGTLSNTARVVTPATGVTDPNDPTRTGANNNSATDTTPINLVSDVRISKSHTGNFTVGVNNSYTLTASNAGNTPTSGTITVTDNLPTGLTVASIPVIANWNCGTTVVGSSLMTCTSTTAIPAGANHPNQIVLSVVVGAAAFAASPVTNVANISGGGEPAALNGNNSASDPTTIIGSPDLTIAKTHTGNFTRGSTGVYTITVTNSGTAVTNGSAVTITDTLPAGLTVTSIPTGTGWNCAATVVGSGTASCTRSTALNAGASYPAITLTVTVSQTAAASVTNSVTVAGGGEPASLNTNNTATDPTTVVSSADLSLTKVSSNSTPTVGQNVTFTITVTNAGPTNATGITVRDQLPAGLTFVSATPAAAYNNATGVWTIGAVNSGANTVLQIVATVTASGTITNTAQVTASGQPDPDSTPNNNAAAEDDQASAALNVAAPPAVGLCKTFPGQTCTPPPSLPPQLPGADITFLIIFTNTGGSPAQGFVITDPVPANTDFRVGSMSATFAGTGLTGVTIQYSNNGGATYVYTPVSGAGGAPAGYDRTVTHVRWVFTGSLTQAAPNNTGNVQFITRIR